MCLNIQKIVNEKDAPLGYYPVPKEAVPQHENICRQCDFRLNCSSVYPCMSYNREDGVSVVFKMLPAPVKKIITRNAVVYLN